MPEYFRVHVLLEDVAEEVLTDETGPAPLPASS